LQDVEEDAVASSAGPAERRRQTGALRYTSTSGERWDSLFFDKPDDRNQSNIFLGSFTTAREKPADFKSIWD
jgi:hypothetical protein